jgi:hypothetical protein
MLEQNQNFDYIRINITILVLYFRKRNYIQMEWLKTIKTLSLTLSMGRNSGAASLVDSGSVSLLKIL